MNVVTLNYGPQWANTYVFGEEGGPCVVVDLGYDKGGIVERYCARHHSFLAGVLLTHGHYDHIAGLSDLSVNENLRVVLHQEDADCLEDPKLNGSYDLSDNRVVIDKELPLYLCEDEDQILLGARQGKDEEGNTFPVGGYEIEVIHTPFHTRGSVCYYLKEEGILFSGDTLFRLGIGRMDLPGARPREVGRSLAKLMALPEKTLVYPGHGPSTTIGQELRYNPYFLELK